MNLVQKVKKHGLVGSSTIAISSLVRKVQHTSYRLAVSGAPEYISPTEPELEQIEADLKNLGIQVIDYAPSLESFSEFQESRYFPLDYHGGIDGPVWDEKLLEHWIAFERLELHKYQAGDIYIDVAAASSPWAKVLRERLPVESFAIDLNDIGFNYKSLPYYRVENATSTTFDESSVKGISLQCAYEMFVGEDDSLLIKEIARILKVGGKAIISPLYMHTHYCAYSTPEFYGKGYSDPLAKEYVRRDCFGVPSSRKYNAEVLKQRVLDPIKNCGMSYELLALRNKSMLGKNIYCHFILEITK